MRLLILIVVGYFLMNIESTEGAFDFDKLFKLVENESNDVQVIYF